MLGLRGEIRLKLSGAKKMQGQVAMGKNQIFYAR